MSVLYAVTTLLLVIYTLFIQLKISLSINKTFETIKYTEMFWIQVDHIISNYSHLYADIIRCCQWVSISDCPSLVCHCSFPHTTQFLWCLCMCFCVYTFMLVWYYYSITDLPIKLSCVENPSGGGFEGENLGVWWKPRLPCFKWLAIDQDGNRASTLLNHKQSVSRLWRYWAIDKIGGV